MPTPSKFTEEVRRAVIDALAVGASRRTAATIAGVSPSQVTRWLARGEHAREGTRWHEFYLQATEARPHLGCARSG
jgi:transposase